MNPKYLVPAFEKLETQYPHLFRLLSPEEIFEFQEVVPFDETPIWEHWVQYVTKTLVLGKSPLTIKSVRDGLNVVIRHTGLLTVEQFNIPGKLDNAMLALQLERNQKSSTRNTYIKNVNTYFIWLYKNHIIDVNNVARIEKGREQPPDVKALSLEQVEKCAIHMSTRDHSTALERARNILMIDVLRFTGIRPCELLGMDNDSIYFEEGRWKMVINGRKQKGRKRYYEVPSYILHSYKHYMQLRADHERWEKPMFISMSSREGWKMSGLQNLFKRISKEMGFRITAYGFRRFIASQLSRSGITREHLSRYMGHSRFTTTDLYIERECYLTKAGAELMNSIYSSG